MIMDESSVRPKLLVPVKDGRCIERLSAWLSANPQVWNAEIMLVHVLEPNWFNDIPYSPLNALQLLDHQEKVTAEVQREFDALTGSVRKRYSDLSISAYVITKTFDTGTAITDLARKWGASCILVFCNSMSPMRKFVGGRLSCQILRSANCVVQVIQSPQEAPADIVSNYGARRRSNFQV